MVQCIQKHLVSGKNDLRAIKQSFPGRLIPRIDVVVPCDESRGYGRDLHGNGIILLGAEQNCWGQKPNKLACVSSDFFLHNYPYLCAAQAF